jgi:5-methylcytosine-specific restriction protein A
MTAATERSFARTLTERPDDVWKIERAPSGRALCRWCKMEVPKGRRTFCSAPCVHEWRIRNSPVYARKQVYKRDRGVCKECGRSAADLVEKLSRERPSLKVGDDHEAQKLAWAALLDSLIAEGFDRYSLLERILWQADHIVEVINGGGTCGLDNLQTLCVPCHKRKTRRLAAERAAARRQSTGQP